MLRNIDRSDTHTIQKVINPRKNTFHYQTIETALIGKGGQGIIHHSLYDARKEIGRTMSPAARETLPKTAYVEQQKGYSK